MSKNTKVKIGKISATNVFKKKGWLKIKQKNRDTIRLGL